jgi:hypothetical protein
MATPTAPAHHERLAHKRANAKAGWYLHATIYTTVNLGLVLLANLKGHAVGWPVFPALGWGVGLLAHGLAVFVWSSASPWRERLVQRERERLQREQGL